MRRKCVWRQPNEVLIHLCSNHDSRSGEELQSKGVDFSHRNIKKKFSKFKKKKNTRPENKFVLKSCEFRQLSQVV